MSTFLLVAGVAGAGLSSTSIALTAIAGGLAGAVSMAAGELLATKSQNEVIHGEIKLEKEHIKKYNREEIEELAELLEIIGVRPGDPHSDLHQRMLVYYKDRPDDLLKIMIALEFGSVETEERSPLTAALFSGCLFIMGSLPSILPFVVKKHSDPLVGLIASAIFTCIALLVVGMIKSWATRGSWLTSAAENLIVAALGGGVAYGVGILFDTILNH